MVPNREENAHKRNWKCEECSGKLNHIINGQQLQQQITIRGEHDTICEHTHYKKFVSIIFYVNRNDARYYYNTTCIKNAIYIINKYNSLSLSKKKKRGKPPKKKKDDRRKKKKSLIRLCMKQGKSKDNGQTATKEPTQPMALLRRIDEEYLQPLPTTQGDFQWVVLNVRDLSLISHHKGNSKVLLDSINDCIKETGHAHLIIVQLKDLLLCISHSGPKASICDRTNLSFCIEYTKRYFAI
ncbi:hypothetical protein RFI_14606, partial [Reticulomyxa filosa]